mgnify:CR=1 FL=1
MTIVLSTSPGSSEELIAYLFISPWLFGFLVFTGGSMLVSLGLSLYNTDLLQQFDFIGLQEHFDEDFAELVRLMDWPEVVPEFINANPQPAYREHLRALRGDSALMARLSRLNAEDVDLYRQAQCRRRLLARA